MPPGDVEGMSHTDLHALVSGARPKDITSRYTALAEAGTKIEEIARDLLKLVEKAEWKGESGDALRTWTRGFAEQGANLGTYARSVGDALLTAGEGLTQAKSAMPKPKPGGHPSTAEGGEFERQEALIVIDRLTSYYAEATNQATRPEKPNFAPLGEIAPVPPAPAPPIGPSGDGVVSGSGEAWGGDGRMGVNQETSRPSPGAQDTNAPGVVGATLPPADSGIRTGLDSVAAQPDTRPQAPNTSQPPATTLPGTGGGTAAPVPAPYAPPTYGQATAPRGGSTSGESRTSSGGALGNGQRQVRGTVPGTPGYGIHGGTPRPVSSPPSAAGMPRGTVIGAEPGSVGRPGSGSPYGFGNRGGDAAGRSDVAPNRRVSSETAGASNRRPAEFTRGGTGLVRSDAPIAGAPNNRTRRGDRNRTNTQRPGYLKESEETWSPARRKIIPPVIDS